MLIGLHFPFRFDPQLLRADLATAHTLEWPAHYNERDYGGAWSGIALRSVTGEINQLIAGSAGRAVFADTPLLDRCPYFRRVLSAFECPLKSVRLLSLAPQSFIREHSDNALGYDDGEIRIHVPIQTNPEVEFYVAGERLLLEEGHSYFINVNLPHRVNNRGPSQRIHLVIDAEVNEWVDRLFRQGAAEHWDVPRCSLPPRNVDDFRRYVLAKPALERQLQTIETGAQFTSAALDLGRSLGFDFHDGDIGAALRCGPLPVTESSALTSGWTPARVYFRGRRPLAEWVYTGTRRFSEPSFENSIKVALRNPFAQFFRRELPLELATEIESSGRALEPSGFIFHMSRCGSTLISRMLAALPRYLTVCEAPPLDDVIQAKRSLPNLTDAEHIQWLRWIAAALGQRRTGDETHYFVKMDAWHIHHLPLIRAAFPNVPWIFVYRDPLEVMVSQLARPGRLTIPGALDPGIFGLEPAAVTGLSREIWCARVLAAIFRAALAARSDPKALCIEYRDLPEAVFGSIARHFGLLPSAAEAVRMRDVTAFDANNPALWFTSDSQRKQATATPVVRDLCVALLDEPYRELNEWKLAPG
jgi:hypothetical protein